MLSMTTFPALVTPFSKTLLNNKGAINNTRITPSCLSLTLLPKRLLPMKYPQLLPIRQP